MTLVSVTLIVIKLQLKTFLGIDIWGSWNFKDSLNIFCDVECIYYTFNRATSVKIALLFSEWDYSQTESSISRVPDSARNLRKHRGLSHDAADSQCKVNLATKYLPNYSLGMQMKSWKWVNAVYTQWVFAQNAQMLSQWHVLLCIRRLFPRQDKCVEKTRLKCAVAHIFINFRDGCNCLFNPTLLKAFITAVRLKEIRKISARDRSFHEITEYFVVGRTMKPRREQELSQHQGRNDRIARTMVSGFPKSRDWGNHLRILHRNKSKVSRCSLNNRVTFCVIMACRYSKGDSG